MTSLNWTTGTKRLPNWSARLVSGDVVRPTQSNSWATVVPISEDEKVSQWRPAKSHGGGFGVLFKPSTCQTFYVFILNLFWYWFGNKLLHWLRNVVYVQSRADKISSKWYYPCLLEPIIAFFPKAKRPTGRPSFLWTGTRTAEGPWNKKKTPTYTCPSYWRAYKALVGSNNL